MLVMGEEQVGHQVKFYKDPTENLELYNEIKGMQVVPDKKDIQAMANIKKMLQNENNFKSLLEKQKLIEKMIQENETLEEIQEINEKFYIFQNEK